MTPPALDPPRVNILGVGISALTLDQTVEQLLAYIENREPVYVVVCPVYTVMLCQTSDEFRAIVNKAALVTPDGMPLVYLCQALGYPDTTRVYGPDLMLAFSQRAADCGCTNFYYGAAPGTPEAVADSLQQRYPGLEIVGTYSPPFRDLTPEEEDEIVEMINAANPDVVWVGIGSYKQEIWMHRFRARLNAPVLIGVGAAFDYHAGLKKQAPMWMQRHALEWLYRLLKEPARLWQRYIINNPMFIMLVFLQLTGLVRFPLDTGDDGD
ncbi:MAG: WecB/TagA/CpsF family glycosyltransferase [Anaerolineae bacterium]|nr:WecB/TagA/CpsF family glycosyltransferase [Anaerolineae bacterium]